MNTSSSAPSSDGVVAADPMQEARALAALAALAQDTRLRLFRTLVGAGPAGMTPSELMPMVGGAAATLSFHLKELSRAGLVVGKREGRFIRYSADIMRMNQLMDYLTAHCCQGEPCGDGRPMMACEAVFVKR